MLRCIAAVLSILVPAFPLAAGSRGYYRFPAIHENTVVFTAEGDLWKVGIEGGPATRLTSHLGQETHAAISADGRMVAFSAEYEGTREVYTMPVDGGRPRRITYDGETATVVGFSPDGRIVYATRHFSTLPGMHLVAVDPRTLAQEPLPLYQAAGGAWDPHTGDVYFTRFRKQSSSTKRYRGGWAQQIWKFARGAREAVPLTAQFTGTSRDPMWHAGRVYYVCDQSGTMNLWSMNAAGADRQQHTFHTGFDVMSPSMYAGKIAYQRGADLHVYDIATRAGRLVPITLPSDFDQTRTRWLKKPIDYLTAVDLSPGGDRLALTARGTVFVASAGKGRMVQITRKAGVRYRWARFLPDGKSLIALSDETGEMEFWKLPAAGGGDKLQITRGSRIFRFAPVPSPDGKRFAYRDKDMRLWFAEIDSGRQSRVAVSDYGVFSGHGGFTGLVWSGDGRWLAYVDAGPNRIDRVFLYDVETKKSTAVTSDRLDSYSPAFSPDGQWLYFLSDRRFVSRVTSPWGPLQPEPYFTDRAKIYHVALQKGLKSPFSPRDEIGGEPPAKSKKKSAAAEKKPSPDTAAPGKRTKIDFAGISSRIRAVPVPAGNYSKLSMNGKQLFWLARNESTRKHTLRTVVMTRKLPAVKTLAADVRDYQLSDDGKKLLVRKSDEFLVFPAGPKPPASLASAKVDLSRWTFPIDPREEWRQMFIDAWRMERDYFYDRGLHGADWKKLRDQHLPLLHRVTDRAELNDVIEQLVGELEALHIYVRGGEHRKGTDEVLPASLGAVLRRDKKAGGYRVHHIYRTDPDFPDKLSPLLKCDDPVARGDVLTAVNGVPLLSVAHPGVLLRNKSGRRVQLSIKSARTGLARTAVVEPISQTAAAGLRYSQWEYTRRLQVEKASNGRIGYVHLRAMGGGNFSEWAREFYPVFNRQGLIIDVRNNRGGNIDSWVLEKLLRKAWFYWQPRVGRPYWNMQYAFRGHMVVLCNQKTASDGEAFAEGFRRLQLGKVIGTRTWGGEIWLSINNRLVDRGYASAAQIGVYGPGRKWLIEGHGVEPDIVVDNLPHATFQGRDAQLEAAVRHLQRKIKNDPRPVPRPPAYPRKPRTGMTTKNRIERLAPGGRRR